MVSFHMMNVWLSVHLNIALILHHTHFGDLRRLCMVWFVLLSTGLNISVLASSLLACKIAQIILVFFMEDKFRSLLNSHYTFTYDDQLDWFLGMKFDWLITPTSVHVHVH